MSYISPFGTLIEPEQQIRLGLQGYPNTGKTWAALTFPEPTVLNIDRGLGAHVGRRDVIDIPIWNREVCLKIDLNFKPHRMKDVITMWLEKEGMKMERGQTLVIDSGTQLQAAYHLWFEQNKNAFLTKEGKTNDFAEWQQKRVWFGELMTLFKAMKCNVVYICHESDQRDKVSPGSPVSYSGKIRPLMSGTFADELASHFTDWFRSLVTEVGGKTEYQWQTQGDNTFDAKASSLVGAPKIIPANYQSFITFRRK